MEHEINGFLENDPNIPTSQHPVLSALQERLASLEKSIESKNDLLLHWQGVASANSNSKTILENSLRDVIVELHSDGEISDDIAKKILEACSIEATKEVTITGSITFSGTVEVSIFEDLDNYSLRYNVDVDTLDVSAFGNDLERFDYDLEDVEIS